MRLTIFSRLVIGYFVIFILAMTVSIYSIAQLRQLEKVTQSILFIDNRLIDYEKNLSDILLSMMRYEKKFIIIRDHGLYDQFMLAKDDFHIQLKGIMTVADTDKARDFLMRIEQLQRRYESLFTEEVSYIKSGQQYSVDTFKQEKEYTVNGIMEALKELRSYIQWTTYEKVNRLSGADINASKVAIVTGVVSLIFGIIISVVITVGITRPLSVIKKKTGEIARGEFGDDLELSSPPEIMMLEQSFNSMCAKLKEIDKMKSDFFSLMSHELRTPLTTIREGTNLFLEGLEDGKATEKQKRLLTIINEECNRLINMVNSLLDLSKMEAGMMTYNFSQEDIYPLISKITGEMEPLVETKKISLETEIEKELPKIKMDIERMLQVLRNLIGNAVKFTPDNGTVRIYAGSVAHGLKVSIADTGTGISKEKIEMVFEKYHQDILAGSNKLKGSGLGLSIVKQIINAHGGKVWVENTSDRGSTFSFVLPA
ncbi:MAG: HAMP domain-containing histidine kinase [Nitrospirae bacterium]|nr:HAMP domain-containing histidine kinase [Nitrospirota bacterium]